MQRTQLVLPGSELVVNEATGLLYVDDFLEEVFDAIVDVSEA